MTQYANMDKNYIHLQHYALTWLEDKTNDEPLIRIYRDYSVGSYMNKKFIKDFLVEVFEYYLDDLGTSGMYNSQGMLIKMTLTERCNHGYNFISTISRNQRKFIEKKCKQVARDTAWLYIMKAFILTSLPYKEQPHNITYEEYERIEVFADNNMEYIHGLIYNAIDKYLDMEDIDDKFMMSYGLRKATEHYLKNVNHNRK